MGREENKRKSILKEAGSNNISDPVWLDSKKRSTCHGPHYYCERIGWKAILGFTYLYCYRIVKKKKEFTGNLVGKSPFLLGTDHSYSACNFAFSLKPGPEPPWQHGGELDRCVALFHLIHLVKAQRKFSNLLKSEKGRSEK